MREMTLNETADFLESATIEKTLNAGFAIVHYVSFEGAKFLIVNRCKGGTLIIDSHGI